MYKVTRKEAAEILKISTRSVDRYIRAGKLRSKKEGKIVYINEDDINNLLGINNKRQEVIFGGSVINNNLENAQLLPKDDGSFSIIFEKLRQEIKDKDEEIKSLSMKIGKMEEVIKNSISIIEFKKTQFLLEEGKNYLSMELENVKKELRVKEENLKEEKKLNYILTATVALLFIALILVWIARI